MSIRRLVALMLVCAMPGSALATLTTSVDSSEIDELQTIVLTLRSTGSTDAQSLDLSPLEKDWEVQNTNTQSQFRSINGRVSSWVEYRIFIRPKRTGTLVIPGLRVGSERSEPLTVRVEALDPRLRREIDKLVYFDIEFGPAETYVQAQAILSRKLYYTVGVQIYDQLPGAPEIADAVVIPLGEARSDAVVIDGVRYGILEQRYALFPEKSGKLTVPGFSVAASVRIPNGSGFSGRRGVRVHAPPVAITVMGIPSHYPSDAPWLPALDVQIEDTWQPNVRQYAAGDNLTREVVVNVAGNVGSAIPPLDLQLPDENFKQYPEPPVLNDDHSSSLVTGQRVQRTALIATQGGEVTVPGPRVVWWDTRRQEVQIASSANRTVTITGTLPATDLGTDITQPDPTNTSNQNQSQATAQDADDEAVAFPWLQAVLWFTITLLMCALLFELWRRSAPYRARWSTQRSLKARIADGSLAQVKQAVIEYAAYKWDISPTHARQRIAGLAEYEQVEALLQRADALSFGGTAGDPQEREKVRTYLQRSIDQLVTRKPGLTGKPPALPPLYDQRV